ncbi:TPA: hypothetical protein ACG3I4_000967 [Clostridioides difficile]|uniref:hypothetical protein n=1 Tax=Clostridioides difficile TaxID=1496 RepID=UPI00097FE7DB|nr:hypothetical protein [Clostridioides difficile]EKJ1397758.1 hypothetical protein [Clostridioides difficile]MCI9995073.1 hypothetical protein [Clostridioides difficile]MDV9594961.1 hypothetical protein [Clostridioides difficile]MDV9594975.1 hypothetical protein [Clostridioides difficile]MDV9595007.1 hypothetical protein [Clostridioides difficile]
MRKKFFIGILIVLIISVIAILNIKNDKNVFIGESENWKAKFVTTEGHSKLKIKYKNSKDVVEQKFNYSYKFIDGEDAVVVVKNEILEAGQEKAIKIQRPGLYSNRESTYKLIISWNGNEETINLKKK